MNLRFAFFLISALLSGGLHAVPAGETALKRPDLVVFVPPRDLGEGWYARIDTDKGRILLELLPQQAPQSVAHFAGLANGTLEWPDPVTGDPVSLHFYDGIAIDSAEAGRRFEAGGLDRDLARVPPELYVNPEEGHGPVGFAQPGRIGLTRFIGGRISGVKFFVTAAGAPYLQGQHPCFGRVIEGLDVALKISEVKTYGNGNPIDPVMIHQVRVFSVGEPPPLAEPERYVPRLERIDMRADP